MKPEKLVCLEDGRTDGRMCKWSITMVKDSVAILAQAGSADSATRTDSLFAHC